MSVRCWIVLGLVACGEAGDTGEPEETGATGDTGTPAPEGLAIAGTYTDEFGTEHVIDDVAWTQTYPGYDAWTFEIASYDNDGMFVVARNGDDNPFNAGQWSRFDWTGDLYVCQTVFDAASEEDAAAASRPDDTDLAGGCGGFQWTDLRP